MTASEDGFDDTWTSSHAIIGSLSSDDDDDGDGNGNGKKGKLG